MAIPKEILELKPKNTRVKATSNPNVFNVINNSQINPLYQSMTIVQGV